ncbi:MAG: type II toxin-antitoxin system PemK/MazF family toxin, partial [Anoxybacillus ayderensis]|nr:type II toxin-antitoxin system PemK/MazF family toxin [Anoxybacillus ayderensis]
MSADVPERGDFVVLNFNPQAGHEQAGRRNAIVLSPKKFNQATGFIAVCPIT